MGKAVSAIDTGLKLAIIFILSLLPEGYDMTDRLIDRYPVNRF